MNALDLPPRRELPPRTRDRIRRAIHTGVTAPPPRSRTPITVAAAVTLLAVFGVVGALVAPHSKESLDPGPLVPRHDKLIEPVEMMSPDATTDQDLDDCGAVLAESGREDEFAPRQDWQPKYTVTAPDAVRITALRDRSDTPSFCEVGTTTATMSAPATDGVPIAVTSGGTSLASVSAVYLSPDGVLAGIADGVATLTFEVLDGTHVVAVGGPALRDGLFVVNLGELRAGQVVEVIAYDVNGVPVASGTTEFVPPNLPPAGVTGPVG